MDSILEEWLNTWIKSFSICCRAPYGPKNYYSLHICVSRTHFTFWIVGLVNDVNGFSLKIVFTMDIAVFVTKPPQVFHQNHINKWITCKLNKMRNYILLCPCDLSCLYSISDVQKTHYFGNERPNILWFFINGLVPKIRSLLFKQCLASVTSKPYFQF